MPLLVPSELDQCEIASETRESSAADQNNPRLIQH